MIIWHLGIDCECELLTVPLFCWWEFHGVKWSQAGLEPRRVEVHCSNKLARPREIHILRGDNLLRHETLDLSDWSLHRSLLSPSSILSLFAFK